MSTAPTFEFYEEQWFARRWWWLIAAISLLPLCIEAGMLRKPFTWQLLLTGGVAGLLPLVLLGIHRLTVRVDAAGIHYRYVPLLNRWRHWPWSEFRRVFPRTYSPLGEYGGWGIKGLPGDLAYNVWGPAGLQLVFQSGNKLLLGTQKPEELHAVLAALQAADASKPITLDK